jgi:hypothetical protein
LPGRRLGGHANGLPIDDEKMPGDVAVDRGRG